MQKLRSGTQKIPENNRRNFHMMEVNPAIGSGFDATRGTFSGDSRSSSVTNQFAHDTGADHPFHNVDHNTMMAMKKALVVLQKVKGDNSVHQIADRLYLGSIGAALNLPELQSVGITHILCTATGVRSMHPDKFIYKTVTVLDSQSELLVDHFAESIHWMECVLRESASHKILVHCFAGRSRSVAIVLAYLMYKLHIPLSVALLHVRQFRANANPNVGFINQLKAFELELFASKRSFAFDSLLDDLASLLPGAKERLKTITDGRVSVTPSDRPPRATASLTVSSGVPPAAVLRSRSSDARLLSSDKTAANVSEEEKPIRKIPSLRAVLFRWLILLVLVLVVVGIDRVSYPHYSRPLCERLGSHMELREGTCQEIRTSIRFETEVKRAFHKAVQLVNHFIDLFPTS